MDPNRRALHGAGCVRTIVRQCHHRQKLLRARDAPALSATRLRGVAWLRGARVPADSVSCCGLLRGHGRSRMGWSRDPCALRPWHDGRRVDGGPRGRSHRSGPCGGRVDDGAVADIRVLLESVPVGFGDDLLRLVDPAASSSVAADAIGWGLCRGVCDVHRGHAAQAK